MKKRRVPINAYGGGKIASTLLSGYYKFGAQTFGEGFNGAMSILEYGEDDRRSQDEEPDGIREDKQAGSVH